MITYIMGRNQKVGGRSGIEDLYESVQGPGYRDHSQLFPWNYGAKKIAKTLIGKKKMLIGYSYGGSTVKFVCDQLRLLVPNEPIDLVVLIDAVWRKKDGKSSVGSLFKRKKIYLPENINKVYSWRQSIGKIKGHRIITSGETFHCKVTLAQSRDNHLSIDDNEEIHWAVRNLAWDFLKS